MHILHLTPPIHSFIVFGHLKENSLCPKNHRKRANAHKAKSEGGGN